MYIQHWANSALELRLYMYVCMYVSRDSSEELCVYTERSTCNINAPQVILDVVKYISYITGLFAFIHSNIVNGDKERILWIPEIRMSDRQSEVCKQIAPLVSNNCILDSCRILLP